MTDSQKVPWKRVLIEAGAIVASILLAFAIDAWWDERKDRIEEQQVLVSLYAEFEGNRDEAASVVATHEAAVRAVASLLQLEDEEILALSADDVQRYIRYLANPRTFDALRGSVDALTGAGKLGILTDRRLREALATFINILDDAEEDREYLSVLSLTVWKEIVRNGGPWWINASDLTPEDCARPRPHRDCYINEFLAYLPVATPQDLLRLRNNSVLMGYVNRNKMNAVRYASEIRQAEIQIKTILALIEENL